MFAIKLDFVLFFMLSHVSHCQRRIEGGLNVTTKKPYVVYLVKATLSIRNYDYWLCGGALVTSDFIITSAACVEDVNYLYAIAGYNKYVTDDEIDKDECTKNMKKKVVFTCVPVSYNFNFDLLEKWAYIDIALVKVESPYDFGDTTYEEICSYIPTVIPINYDTKYQTADTDSMVLGWGHASLWRKHGDFENYNSELLQYTPTLIMDKRECMKEYEVYPNMTYIIEQYMICTLKEGNINDQGQPIEKSSPMAEGCPSPKILSQTLSCKEPPGGNQNIYYDMNTRREDQKTNKTYYNYTSYEFIKKAAREKNSKQTRRNGICQNDHGGPIVTWVGSREVLIGVASVFKIDEYNDCIGPFLYTSTQCNGAFIDCVLNSPELSGNKNKTRRMELCDSPPSVKGFDMIQNHISWKNHPAGPAENEIYPGRELNENVAPQEDFVSNKNMAQNEQFPKNQQSVATIEPFRGNQQYAPNEPFAARQPYPPKEQFTASQQYAPNEHFVANQQYAGNEQYARNENQHRFQGYPENYVPPRERYQGSKKFARLGEYSMRPQRPL